MHLVTLSLQLSKQVKLTQSVSNHSYTAYTWTLLKTDVILIVKTEFGSKKKPFIQILPDIPETKSLQTREQQFECKIQEALSKPQFPNNKTLQAR